MRRKRGAGSADETSPSEPFRETIAFRITPALAEQLRRVAATDGTTVSRTVEHLLIPGLLLPDHARQALRRFLRRGGPNVVPALRSRLTAAVCDALVVLERTDLMDGKSKELTDVELEQAFVKAVSPRLSKTTSGIDKGVMREDNGSTSDE